MPRARWATQSCAGGVKVLPLQIQYSERMRGCTDSWRAKLPLCDMRAHQVLGYWRRVLLKLCITSWPYEVPSLLLHLRDGWAVHESVHLLQPVQVLALLLEVGQVAHRLREALVQAAVLQV